MRHALRRLFWIVPILIGVTLTSFALLSYVPDPADDPAVTATLAGERALELKRSRYLDLPRFFNERPLDVVGRVDAALAHLAADDPLADEARATLVRLGGAALPYLLPRLDGLEPAARARVAVALSPIAERMGIATEDTVEPLRAIAFWNRFWADRAIDFRAANAKRAVRRLSVHGTQTREADLLELDTFALDQIMLALDELSRARETPGASQTETLGASSENTREPVEAMRRLVAAAAHVSGREDAVPDGAAEADVLATVRRWREWWLVHQSDYTAYEGASRFLAMLTDTQYAKWAERVVLLGFGTSSEDTPILTKLRQRAPATLMLMTSAIAFAYAIALALGVASAARDDDADRWALAASLALFAMPTVCLAVWAARYAGPGVLLGAVVLGASMVASPLAQGRTLVREIMTSDYVRAARGFGIHPASLALRHALRATLLPLVALASVEMPTALGGAFVVEKVFGIAGLGEETVHAVQSHDVAWLVGLAFLTALFVTLTSIATDFAIAAIDPRLSLAALRHRRTSA
jgi:ABC-type dipeptide/oligopeptide/nickel transport system permease component